MDIKFHVVVFCVLQICDFGAILVITNKFLEYTSGNCLKNTTTFHNIASEGQDDSRKRLKMEEKAYYNGTVTEIHYSESLSSSNSLNQNSDDKKNFFVITAIFNPASYQSRHILYQNFVRHMNETGAQLITIECIFPSLNQTEFQVTEPNNPWHIQLKSQSVYWIKENLINIAVSRLPPHAKWVCWLDSDIKFDNPNWVEMSIKAMQNYTVVQVFERAHFLGPAPEKKILFDDFSFGYSVVHNKTINPKFYNNSFPHPGYGWVMTVEHYRKINGLPDYIITGDGDHLFAYSLINAKSYPLGEYKEDMDPEYVKMITDRLSLNFPKLTQLAESNKKHIVGYIPVKIRHYWHGSRENRQYRERLKILSDNKFNLHNDVIINEDGLLQFNSNKPNLHKAFVEYFEARHEDSNDLPETNPAQIHTSYNLFKNLKFVIDYIIQRYFNRTLL